MSQGIRSLFAAVFFLLATSGAVHAEPAAPSLSFKVTLFPAGSFEATSSALSGSALATAGGHAAEKVVLPVASLKTGIALRDKHMSQKYLESAKFPMATLTQARGKDGKFTARLELHGQTRDISGSYDVRSSTDGSKFIEARFKTSLSTFEIEEASYMGVGVEDEVEVTARVPLGKSAP